ncbi:hypothetical protein Tco_1102380 [Tanacetum coccineum]
MSSMGELTFFLALQVKQKPNGIFISQDKYVDEILKKFDFANVKSASTPIETQKPLVKDEEASDVDVHLYRSMIGSLMYVLVLGLWYPREMIGSLMYVTASRPDIMFSVCACSRFQVTPKTSHLTAVKRIFRYLKGKPKLGLWYPRESTFDLESYSDSDYAGANLDRKSTTGGCQFLGRRLITWQCKKQTIVATSTTEAEYVAAASCCGQVLWIQNQMLDYGFNFMNTKIYIDNESTICIVKNPVYHSKTKHIAIRHHFIRDAYEKKLIQVLKIHTNDNVADLLTKAFDVSRFQFLVVSIGMSWLDGSGDGVYLCFNVVWIYKSFVDLRRIRESLIRVTNGTEALLILTLFILCLDKVSTDHVKSPKPIRIHFNRPITHAISSTDILDLQALISLTDDLSLRSNMAALESCPKHNMIAYLEKTEGNVEFHEVIDFLQRSYISHALTVSPVVSTTFVEQFWTSAKSKTINNARHITAKVAGKLVSISEASIRTDLLFDDANGIDTLPNQAIFDAIQLMGYEGDLTVLTFNKALFSPQWRLRSQSSKGKLILSSNTSKHIRREYQRNKTSKETSLKRRKVQIESVSKQGRKNARGDGKAKENAQSEGRTKEMMDEDKETDEVGLSTERSYTAKTGVSPEFEKLVPTQPMTDQKLSTDDPKPREGIEEKVKVPADEKTKAISKEKEKGVELKDVEDTDRPKTTSTRTTLNFKPPSKKIDPKDKGKKKIEEEDETESEDEYIPQEDLNAVYQLVMNKYQDEMPEGFERVLWGDLMVLFNPDEQDEFWSSQHEWKIISWKLESEEESTMALELIRFIKKAAKIHSVKGTTEADASAGDTAEVGIDPMTAPLVEEEIVEPAEEDSPNSSGTRDGIVRLVEDMPVDLGDAVRGIYHHMSEVRVDRIIGIETAQRRLEADQLIASGDRKI